MCDLEHAFNILVLARVLHMIHPLIIKGDRNVHS